MRENGGFVGRNWDFFRAINGIFSGEIGVLMGGNLGFFWGKNKDFIVENWDFWGE